MRGANWNAGGSRREQRQSACCFGAKATDRLQFCDLRSHGVHDAPAAEIRAKSHGKVRAENNRPMKMSPSGRELVPRDYAVGVQGPGDNAHRLLRVIAAVSQAVRGGGE